jgi:hypothetical protein
VSQIVTATETQHPTVAELEEAITHLAQTCVRYGQHALRYGEWHEEINALLDDRDRTLNQMAAEALILSEVRRSRGLTRGPEAL